MKKLWLTAAIFAATGCFCPPVFADDERERGEDKQVFAVFGDWPYNQNLLTNAPLLLNSVNSDREISRVIHVGDIHSGSQACTSAGILPPIPTSNPGWNQSVFSVFQKFNVPVVYTPGDNEWTDCHKTKQFKSGDPLKELASVRALFFSRPGKTLGVNEADVWSQSRFFDPAFPVDAQFVENVVWDQGATVFATFNMPGSNNDSLAWTNGFENPAAQLQERLDRTAANIRWLKSAFKHARERHAKSIVIVLQADMWDPAAVATGGDGLDKYTDFVRELATQSLAFNKPVLLLNGDTHLFLADQPLANPSSASGLIHRTPAVPNLTRIVVQGSTNAPAEWLRLTIDHRHAYPFSWTNVPYCANPLGSCQ